MSEVIRSWPNFIYTTLKHWTKDTATDKDESENKYHIHILVIGDWPSSLLLVFTNSTRKYYWTHQRGDARVLSGVFGYGTRKWRHFSWRLRWQFCWCPDAVHFRGIDECGNFSVNKSVYFLVKGKMFGHILLYWSLLTTEWFVWLQWEMHPKNNIPRRLINLRFCCHCSLSLQTWLNNTISFVSLLQGVPEKKKTSTNGIFAWCRKWVFENIWRNYNFYQWNIWMSHAGNTIYGFEKTWKNYGFVMCSFCLSLGAERGMIGYEAIAIKIDEK